MAGWRWCFYVGLPFAIAAVILLQKTLHLPERPPRAVRIDYLGAGLITGGVSCLLVWISLAGQNFAWVSTPSTLLVIIGLMLLGLALLVESRAIEPIIPLALFRNRTFVLAVIASISVGVAMFGTIVFLTQYMQIGRGLSATLSGTATIPMMVGLIASSTIIGRIISRTGRYKRYMLAGAILLSIGLGLMGSIHDDTAITLLFVYMFIIGTGVGMLMQNLVLSVQNVVPARELGAASSNVAFFRSLSGAIGVSALGAVLALRITSLLPQRLAEAGVPASALGSAGQLPNMSTLPEAVRSVVESTYADSIAEVFLIAAPIAVIAVIAVAFLHEVPLSTRTASQVLQDQARSESAGGADEHEPLTVEEIRESTSALTGADPAASHPGRLT